MLEGGHAARQFHDEFWGLGWSLGRPEVFREELLTRRGSNLIVYLIVEREKVGCFTWVRSCPHPMLCSSQMQSRLPSGRPAGFLLCGSERLLDFGLESIQ